MRRIVAVKRVLWDALGHFNADDGWSMASHLAITALMALFPFLIFATSLASFLGADAFADTAVHIIFDTWPDTIAGPIAREVENVLTVQRGDFLTISILVAGIFASNGIEALRTALNRAYRVAESRSFIFRRLQSVFFVVLTTIGFLAISLLLVLAPLAVRLAVQYMPWIEEYESTATIWHYLVASPLWRYLVASGVIVVGLVAAHLWLPAGRRGLLDIAPGIVFTLGGWLLGSVVFGTYLEYFSSYASTYAGLASIMVAVVFLYMIAMIFILGGEINASIGRYLEARAKVPNLGAASPATPPAS